MALGLAADVAPERSYDSGYKPGGKKTLKTSQDHAKMGIDSKASLVPVPSVPSFLGLNTHMTEAIQD